MITPPENNHAKPQSPQRSFKIKVKFEDLNTLRSWRLCEKIYLIFGFVIPGQLSVRNGDAGKSSELYKLQIGFVAQP